MNTETRTAYAEGITKDCAIIALPFDGCAQSAINKDGIVAYSKGLNFEQYKQARPHLELLCITWDDYQKLHSMYFLKPLQEITEAQFYEMFECLPPFKCRTMGGRFFTFFCSEAMSGDIHGFYVEDKKTGKFYAGYKSQFETVDTLIRMINEEVTA